MIDGTVDRGTFEVAATRSTHCQHYHQFSNGLTSTTITCRDNGTWDALEDCHLKGSRNKYFMYLNCENDT